MPVWLNSRADGAKFIWMDNNTVLDKQNPVWLRGDPTSIYDRLWHYLDNRVTNQHCLALAVWHENWSERPTLAYASIICWNRFYTICTGMTTTALRICISLLLN